jgi:hypothetical protein
VQWRRKTDVYLELRRLFPVRHTQPPDQSGV